MDKISNAILYVIIIIIIGGLLVLVSPQLPILNYMTEIVGSLGGVLLAFLIERRRTKNEDDLKRVAFLERIKAELEFDKTRLGKTGDLLKTDIWRSGISSGVIQLLTPEELISLSILYNEIDNYEYESKRCRDVGEDYNKYSYNLELSSSLRKHWLTLSTNLEIIKSELVDHLIKVLINITI